MTRQLHDAMAARIARGEFPGLVALVDRDDDVTVHALGVTEFGGDVPMRRDTVFRIASMTKPVIGAATLMLAEDDLLDLEEPVDRLLPELKGQRVLARPDAPLTDTVPRERQVTVADLLTFTFGSGVAEGADDFPIAKAWRDRELVTGAPDPPTPHDPDEWIRIFGELPLIHQPGEAWMYNVGSLVLGVLLARAAGKPLARVLSERIFEPLGMSSTGFTTTAPLPTHYMTDFGQDRLEEQTVSRERDWSVPPAFPSGAGGLVSTADDFLAFARMLLNRGVHGGTRLLSEQSVASMTSNHLSPEQIASGGVYLGGSGWGYGLAVTVEGPRRYGWSGGYGTTWLTYPDERVTLIVLSQVTDLIFNGTITEFGEAALIKP